MTPGRGRRRPRGARGAGPGRPADHLGKVGHCRSLEQRREEQVLAGSPLDVGEQAHGVERAAPEVEEALVHAHVGPPEDPHPRVPQHPLDIVGGLARDAGLGRSLAGENLQRAPVGLPCRGHRHRGEGQQLRRQHEPGQARRGRGLPGGLVEAFLRAVERHEPAAARVGLSRVGDDHGRGAHPAWSRSTRSTSSSSIRWPRILTCRSSRPRNSRDPSSRQRTRSPVR